MDGGNHIQTLIPVYAVRAARRRKCLSELVLAMGRNRGPMKGLDLGGRSGGRNHIKKRNRKEAGRITNRWAKAASKHFASQGKRSTCKYCKLTLPEHLDDCILNKINPGVISVAMVHANDELRKHMNDRRIFRNDPHTKGRSGGGFRKPKRKPPSLPPGELKYCHKCETQRLHRFDEASRARICLTCNRR